MINVYKNVDDIPVSLRTDAKSILKGPAKTTHEHRLQIIKDGSYPASPSASYDARYKYIDIKKQLDGIYHGKCAFCETRNEQLHVEHFRPKRGGYYWLAYSWDNLLLACATCNSFKGNDFPLDKYGTRASFDPSYLSNINNHSAQLNQIERPLLINPETAPADVDRLLIFDEYGEVSSNDLCMVMTIEKCRLSRKALCNNRKKILDDLRNEIHACVNEAQGDLTILQSLLQHVKNNFVRGLEDETAEYIAFRRYILRTLIKEEIKKVFYENV